MLKQFFFGYFILLNLSDVRSPGLSPKTPNYFSLPITLTSLKSLSNEQNGNFRLMITIYNYNSNQVN